MGIRREKKDSERTELSAEKSVQDQAKKMKTAQWRLGGREDRIAHSETRIAFEKNLGVRGGKEVYKRNLLVTSIRRRHLSLKLNTREESVSNTFLEPNLVAKK